MGRVCCVSTCRRSSTKNSELRYFSIPSIIKNQCVKTKALSEKRRKLWLNQLSLSPRSVKNQRVCSRHFHSGKIKLNVLLIYIIYGFFGFKVSHQNYLKRTIITGSQIFLLQSLLLHLPPFALRMIEYRDHYFFRQKNMKATKKMTLLL